MHVYLTCHRFIQEILMRHYTGHQEYRSKPAEPCFFGAYFKWGEMIKPVNESAEKYAWKYNGEN